MLKKRTIGILETAAGPSRNTTHEERSRRLAVAAVMGLLAAATTACSGGSGGSVPLTPGLNSSTTPGAGEVGVNRPPSISGTAPAMIVIDQEYRFAPMIADPDGDSLEVSVQSLPAWLGYDTPTGALTGVPTQAEIGAYENIVISVSDGELTAMLEPFTISVVAYSDKGITVRWSAPTERTDGLPLTNLAGFRIYRGRSADRLAELVELANPGIDTYRVDNLSDGQWYFALTAFDSHGIESNRSDTISLLIE